MNLMASVNQKSSIFHNLKCIDRMGILTCNQEEISVWGNTEVTRYTAVNVYPRRRRKLTCFFVTSITNYGLMSTVASVNKPTVWGKVDISSVRYSKCLANGFHVVFLVVRKCFIHLRLLLELPI